MRQACSSMVLTLIVVGCATGAGTAQPARPGSPAPGFAPAVSAAVKVKFFTPKQFAAGSRREVTVRLAADLTLEAAEVAPPDGVVVSGIRRLDDRGRDDESRWRMTFAVAPDTTPGERSVVLITAQGRSERVVVTIPPHAPRPLSVEVLDVTLSPLKVSLAMLVDDDKDDLGESPSVTTVLTCGGSFLMTLGHASRVVKVGDHRYRLEFTVGGDPGTRATGEAACTLKVEVTNQSKYEGEIETAILLKPRN